jgi:pilus assembly protein CpaD
MSTTFLRVGPTRAAIVALASGLALAGCGVNHITANADMSADGRERHPIVLTESNYTVDLFPVGKASGLDKHTVYQLRDFVRNYRALGQGPVTMLVPRGGPSGAQAEQIAPVMRAALEHELEGPVSFVPYSVSDPAVAAPVRLTFTGVKAKVAHRCGDWPSDLASGSSLRGWENETYWNFGCSNQSVLAAQVADPRDLAGQQGEQPTDTAFRVRAITSVRGGKDPGTTWKTTNTQIGTVGQ